LRIERSIFVLTSPFIEPFPHSLEIPSGFPHYHGLDGGLGV
jgi:hypothetical protein